MIIKEKAGSTFEPIAEGLHLAQCVLLAGIGSQTTPWGEKEQLILGFEIPSVRRKWEKDGVDHDSSAMISNTYTASLSENANLRGVLQSWRGRPFTAEELKGFDLSTVVGAPCQVFIKHSEKDGKTYANINDVLKAPKGESVQGIESKLINYDPSNHDPLAFSELPEWIQNKVSTEVAHSSVDAGHGEPITTDMSDEDIPF
jgi:hypothetical protein